MRKTAIGFLNLTALLILGDQFRRWKDGRHTTAKPTRANLSVVARSAYCPVCGDLDCKALDKWHLPRGVRRPAEWGTLEVTEAMLKAHLAARAAIKGMQADPVKVAIQALRETGATTRLNPGSWPLDPITISTGPVVLDSKSARADLCIWKDGDDWPTSVCLAKPSGAFRWFELTLAPAAPEITSTSPRPDSPSSVVPELPRAE